MPIAVSSGNFENVRPGPGSYSRARPHRIRERLEHVKHILEGVAALCFTDAQTGSLSYPWIRLFAAHTSML